MNSIALLLLEATISLYPANADGSPQLSRPVWAGACAKHLAVRERWLKRGIRPTGRRHPKLRALAPQYEISIGRLWALQRGTSDLTDVATSNGRYVLVITWQDERTHEWHRERFYEVTWSERAREAGAADDEFTEGQVFDAEWRGTPESWAGTPEGYTPPPIVVVDPAVLEVRYVTADEAVTVATYGNSAFTLAAAAAGRVWLGEVTLEPAGEGAPEKRFRVEFPDVNLCAGAEYQADGALWSWYRVEVQPGERYQLTLGNAVQVTDSADYLSEAEGSVPNGNTLAAGIITPTGASIYFWTHATDSAVTAELRPLNPVLELTAAGALTAYAYEAGAPTDADLPRLDFMVGPRRVGSVTHVGRVFATAFTEAPAVAATEQFNFYVDGTLAAALSAAQWAAPQFVTHALPASLGLWLEASGLSVKTMEWWNQATAKDTLLADGVGLVPEDATAVRLGTSPVRSDTDVIGANATVFLVARNRYAQTSLQLWNSGAVLALNVPRQLEPLRTYDWCTHAGGLATGGRRVEDAGWHLFEVVRTHAAGTSTLELRVDGVSSGVVTASSVATPEAAPVELGDAADATGSLVVRCVLAFNTTADGLTYAERLQVLTWLRARYL